MSLAELQIPKRLRSDKFVAWRRKHLPYGRYIIDEHEYFLFNRHYHPIVHVKGGVATPVEPHFVRGVREYEWFYGDGNAPYRAGDPLVKRLAALLDPATREEVLPKLVDEHKQRTWGLWGREGWEAQRQARLQLSDEEMAKSDCWDEKLWDETWSCRGAA